MYNKNYEIKNFCLLNPPENVISTQRSSLQYYFIIFCKIAIRAIYDLVQQADLII